MFKRLLFALLLLLLVGVGSWAWSDYQRFLNTPITLASGAEDELFSVEKGLSATHVFKRLKANGVIENVLWMRVYDRISRQPGRHIQAGEYLLVADMTPVSLMQALRDGEVKLHKFTIIEGWNFKLLRQKLAQVEHLKHTLTDLSDAEVMSKLELPDLHPEGQFLPDTYRFPRGMTDVAFLKRAHAALQMVLDEEWQGREEGLPLDSAYQALTLASIIEKETAAAEERARIAGVFVLRLRKDMKLQTDPTVIYGMGEDYKGNIRRKDLKADNPYNTYTRKGLPPTPIAMAGRAAIHATLHPVDGKDLFFVSKGNGTHQFSETLKQHNAAVRKYILKK